MGVCLPLDFRIPLSPFLFFVFTGGGDEAAHRGRAFPWFKREFGLFGDWTVAGNLQDQHLSGQPVESRE